MALSMVLTPPLLMLEVSTNRSRLNPETKRGSAEAIEAGKAPVHIADYGQAGRMIGRILRAEGVKTTELELDADQLEAWVKQTRRSRFPMARLTFYP